jgi:hypothetical protein
VNRPGRAILVAAMLLAGLAVWPWIEPVSAPALSAGATDGGARAPALTVLPPLSTFAAVSERPLFSPSRRPPPDAQPPVSDGGGIGRYRLLGLVTAGETRRALVAEGNRRFEIAEGAVLGGWHVGRIEQDRVVLSSPTGEVELRLRRAEPPESEKRPR